jgi:hypothetical protein
LTHQVPPEIDPHRQELERRRFLRDDVARSSGHIAFFQYVAVGIFLFLVSGFWRLQIETTQPKSTASRPSATVSRRFRFWPDAASFSTATAV